MKTINDVRVYWNNRPCNVRHSYKDIGTREYFDEIEKRKYHVEPHIPYFAQFNKWDGKNVLEIGSGIGTDSVNFVRSGANLTIVELSEKSLDIAKKRFEIYGLKAKFYCNNAENLSSFLPIKTYDLIYSFGVFHHTPYPEKVISEIKKYMNKDSLLKIMVYNRISWKALWVILKYHRFICWDLDKLIARYSEAEAGCPITHMYTKKSIKKLLSGFEIMDIRIEHIFPYKISDYVCYKYKKTWYFRYMPAWMFNLIERYFGWHLCVTARLQR